MKHRQNGSQILNGGRVAAPGFTLIELMIVVAVIAILASIALPSYRDSVMRSKRTLAKTALIDLAAREEKLYSMRNAYSASEADLGYSAMPVSVQDGATTYYSMSVVVDGTVNPPIFSATAEAKNAQLDDKACRTFSINSAGVQSAKDSSGAVNTKCW